MTRRLARRALELAAGQPPEDRALRWRGTASPGRPVLRVAHYGDCSWREMSRSHGVHTAPGYPRAIAAELEREGTGLEFSAWVVHVFEWLPGPDQLETHLHLTGDPDVVMVHVGALYSRMVVLPDDPLVLRLRERIARRLGGAVFTAYRPLRPLVAAFGRFSVPYPGDADLRRFLATVSERWPDARVLVALPFPRLCVAARQRDMQARVRGDVRAAAEAAGATVVDPAPETGSDRCVNGYNLGPESSARFGRRLARELVRPPVRA
jgi:hypothetical protein